MSKDGEGGAVVYRAVSGAAAGAVIQAPFPLAGGAGGGNGEGSPILSPSPYPARKKEGLHAATAEKRTGADR